MASVRLLEKAECRHKLSAKPLRLESNLRRREVSNVTCRDDLQLALWSISCLQIVMIEEEHGRLQAQETSEVATAFVIGAPRCRAKEPNAWKLATCASLATISPRISFRLRNTAINSQLRN